MRRIEAAVVVHVEVEGRRRPKPLAVERGIGQTFRRVVVALVLILTCGMMLFESLTYTEWPPAVYSDPDVLNLTRTGQLWDVHYGPSPVCGTVDCLLTDAALATDYAKTVVLPAHEFPLEGYLPGQTIYYRTHVTLPPALRTSRETLLFHSLYVWAKRYELYIDGALVEVGNAELMNITLPPEAIARGTFTLAFKIDPGDLRYQGLANYGELLIGPKPKLQSLQFQAHDFKTSYYLWYILPRVAFCAMFCLIFLALSGRREHYWFILYAFLSALRLFLYSAYAERWLPDFTRGPAIYLDCLGQAALLAFVHHFFRRGGRLTAWVGRALLASLVVYGGVAFTLLSPEVYQSTTQLLGKGLRLAALGYGVYCAGRAVIYLRATGRSQARLWAATLLLAFFSLALLDVATASFGFYRAAFSQLVPWMLELALFVMLAAFNSVEFGRVTLDRDRLEEEVSRQREAVARARVAEAVARTTQMLAHDLRRPFSLFRIMFGRLERTPDPAAAHTLMTRFLPEFEEAFTSVEVMIADILEIGGHGTPVVVPTVPAVLFKRALRETLRVRRDVDVTIETTLSHSRPLLVDAIKCGRVISNLVDNAIAAMGPQGRLWLTTRDVVEDDRPFVELCVGNSGSYIPPEEHGRVFEAFYTKGKKGGTGLGLAVCEKVVVAHGGRIWCESDVEVGTEFHILLPAGEASPTPLESPVLPRHSDAVRVAVLAAGAPAAVGRPRVLVVEDDPFIADAWQERLGTVALVVNGPRQLWTHLAEDPDLLAGLEVVVVDFHFGEVETGADVATRLRSLTAAPIALSSDSQSDGGHNTPLFDAVIAKEPCDLPTLLAQLASNKRAS